MVSFLNPDAVYADGVASIPMDNTGKITLYAMRALSASAKWSAYDGVKKGPVTSFMFDISISGYTGTAQSIMATARLQALLTSITAMPRSALKTGSMPR